MQRDSPTNYIRFSLYSVFPDALFAPIPVGAAAGFRLRREPVDAGGDDPVR